MLLPSGAARNRAIASIERQRMKVFLRLKASPCAAPPANGSLLLDHDYVLEPYALFQIVKLLQVHPGGLIYSDEDKLTDEWLRSPVFSLLSPDLFRSPLRRPFDREGDVELVPKAGGIPSGIRHAQITIWCSGHRSN